MPQNPWRGILRGVASPGLSAPVSGGLPWPPFMRVPPQLAGVGPSIVSAPKFVMWLPLAASNLMANNGSPWCASISPGACWPPFKVGRFVPYMPWCVVLPLGRGFIFGGPWGFGASTSHFFLACVVWPGFILGRWFFGLYGQDVFVVSKSNLLIGS